MNGIWAHYDVPRHAVHHGVIIEGSYGASYYTSQPAPTQWIAVGLVRPLQQENLGLVRMLVGEGKTGHEAVNELRARMRELKGNAGEPARR